MRQGEIMDDATFFKWLFGTFLGVWYFVTKWTHSRANSAHLKIDEDRRHNGKRFSQVTTDINSVSDKIGVCREKIEEKLHEHSRETMTEPRIIKYVDSTVTPLKESVISLHNELTPKVDAIAIAVARIEEAMKR